MKTSSIQPCELRVTSSTENLSVIRDFVMKSLSNHGVDDDTISKIILAVDEAASNIIRHAYGADHEGIILVTLSCSDDECCVAFIDHGHGFNPTTVKRPDMTAYLKEKRVGGLGLHLMRILMDQVEYTSVEGEYNQLVLKKKLTA